MNNSYGQENNKLGFPGGSDGKESACNVGDPGLIPGSGRFPWRREWQPTPVFLPGEFHGQMSLAGYSPWGHKELDTTERLTLFFSRWFLSSRTWSSLQNKLQDSEYSGSPTWQKPV